MMYSSSLGRPLTPDDVEPVTWALAERGRGHSAAEYLTSVGYAQLVNRHVVGWWQDYDLLLTPTMAQPPAPIGAIGDGSTDDDPMEPMRRAIAYGVFTAGFNSTGQPAVSLPLGQGDEGLPIGVQIIGPYLEDRTTLRFAELIEREFGGFVTPPAL